MSQTQGVEGPAQPRRHADLSTDLGSLIHAIHKGDADFAPDPTGAHCDVLIVGSGYGGAISAASLAGASLTDDPASPPRKARIWLLERGKEYLPGQFPDRFADLPGHVRFNTAKSATAKGTREGLFDIRLGHDVCAVVANGLGGGSLINAGVMLWPDQRVIQNGRWPAAIQQAWPGLTTLSESVAAQLGASNGQAANSVAALNPLPRKYSALAQMAAGDPMAAVPVTVALRPDTISADGVALKTCIGCGDCATGCNHNAKISLDTNLLARAHRLGVKLYTGATVISLARAPGGGWLVEVKHTNLALREHQQVALTIHARRLILSAGTFGSTELLMRARDAGLPMSDQLGRRFSANGDQVAMAYGQKHTVHAFARADVEPSARHVGPTITGMIDLRGGRPLAAGHVIQDLAVPAGVQRVVEELYATTFALHGLSTNDESIHHPDETIADPMAIDDDVIDRSSLLAIIGHDDADGELRWHEPDPDDDTVARTEPCDGGLHVHWPRLKTDPRLEEQIEELEQRCEKSGAGGHVIPNPAWRPLPGSSEFLVNNQRGPLLTAHPLGGCVMADGIDGGVVNHLGQVWQAPAQVYSDLVVLDGAIIPSSLGINPALTIATLAQWALPQLMDEWGMHMRAPDGRGPIRSRTIWATPEFRPPAHSTAWITERLRGKAPDGLHGIEITLRFKEADLYALSRGKPRKTLTVDPAHSAVRMVRLQKPNVALPADPLLIAQAALEDHLDPWHSANTIFRATVAGTLDFFHREASTPAQRRLQSIPAWFFNRGLSDSVQAIMDWILSMLDPSSPEATPANAPGPIARIEDMWHLASRAGEVRRFDYTLQIGEIKELHHDKWPATWDAPPQVGQTITGHKRLTYDRRCNPIKQLMRMELTAFPGLRLPAQPACWLALDLRYLAQQGLPLMRLAKQTDMPTSLLDMSSLLLWMVRVLVNVHVWSMRKPNSPRPGEPQRMAGKTSLLPSPQTYQVNVEDPRFAQYPDDECANIWLTRYPADDPARPPVLLIHGYSTSSTTFAHEACQSGLAGHLWKNGFDVWLVDLRTSSARTKSATHEWRFEDIASRDIPAAIRRMREVSRHDKVDVFAHCMGSAMLWMSLLGPQGQGSWLPPESIRRLCMSQIAPLMHMSPSNVFRTFMMRYAQHFLSMKAYHFRRGEGQAGKDAGLGSELMDRILSLLPYPRHEFDIENPWCPPWQRTRWVGSRHRMDALYGQDMQIRNLSQEARNAIDDLFGPLNLGTIAQVIHFARYHMPTTSEGDACYLTPSRLRQVATFPMMSIHGELNGLSDISGMYAFEQYVRACSGTHQIDYTAVPIPDHGHQDCLIGQDAARVVFPHVVDFFNKP